MPSVRIDGQDYDVYAPSAVAASKVIADMHERLGRPDDPFSKSGEKMMEILIAVWEDLYPDQVRHWRRTMKEYKREELTISEQVRKKTGRSLASIPSPIYHMMRKVFPDFKLDDRETFMKLVRKYPTFRMANKL